MAQTPEGRRANALMALMSREQRSGVVDAYAAAMAELTKVGVSAYGHEGDAVLAAIARAVYDSTH